MVKDLHYYQEEFKKLGYILEKQNRFYGKGYYFIKETDLQAGFTDWKWSAKGVEHIETTLEVLKMAE
ncbi:hypothetical protein [Bacillus mycoides]|uniref:hypothetical protein n=1 Tax=Bacillus mycoides TaxID=1405 RepID=UPI003A807373